MSSIWWCPIKLSGGKSELCIADIRLLFVVRGLSVSMMSLEFPSVLPLVSSFTTEMSTVGDDVEVSCLASESDTIRSLSGVLRGSEPWFLSPCLVAGASLEIRWSCSKKIKEKNQNSYWKHVSIHTNRLVRNWCWEWYGPTSSPRPSSDSSHSVLAHSPPWVSCSLPPASRSRAPTV